MDADRIMIESALVSFDDNVASLLREVITQQQRQAELQVTQLEILRQIRDKDGIVCNVLGSTEKLRYDVVDGNLGSTGLSSSTKSADATLPRAPAPTLDAMGTLTRVTPGEAPKVVALDVDVPAPADGVAWPSTPRTPKVHVDDGVVDVPVHSMSLRVERAGSRASERLDELLDDFAHLRTSAIVGSAVWDVTTTKSLGTNHPFLDASLPEETTKVVRCVFVAAGIYPAEALRGAKYCAYVFYRTFVAAAFIVMALDSMLQLTLHFHVLKTSYAEIIIDCFFVPLYVFLLPSTWVVFRRQYGASGAGGILMQMMHQMSRRKFPWHAVHPSVCVYWICIFVWVILWCCLDGYSWAAGSQIHQRAYALGSTDASWYASVKLASKIAAMPCSLLVLTVSFGCIWAVQLAGLLHTHDLFCYTAVMVKCCEAEHEIASTGLLSELEASVTKRFRVASSSWIIQVLSLVLYAFFAAVTIITWLLVTDDASRVPFLVSYLVLTISVILVLTRPLAQVAEVHEYDVVRELNNPKAIAGSRRFMGDLLIAHLQALEWGFRFGGSVINAKLISSYVSALLITAVASVSQSLLDKMAA